MKLSKLTSNKTDFEEAKSDDGMLNCEHPWQNIASCHEYGEHYEKCLLCGHIMTSRIIKQELESLLSQLEGKAVMLYTMLDDVNKIDAVPLSEISKLKEELQ